MSVQAGGHADLYVAMPWFGTFAGGASAALTSIARAVQACGLEVAILTTCSKSPYRDWKRVVHPPGVYRQDGFRVHRFAVDASDDEGYHRAVRRRGEGLEVDEATQEAFFSEGLNSRALADFVAALAPSTRVLAGPYFQALVPSLVAACPRRVTVMPAFHDEPELRWAPIARLVREARGFVFLSQEEKALAIRCHGAVGGRRLVEAPVTGLGVELPAGLRHEDALVEAGLMARVRHGLPDRYFVYCGRLEAGKGLSYLLPWFAAWSRLRRSRGEEPVPLVLVGAGDESIVPRGPDFVRLGYLADEEKLGVMHGGTALVNPSTVESFSYVVMESWLTRRPVLVPRRCAVTAGHVLRSRGGFAYDDEPSFGAALDALLDDELNGRLGDAGRRYVMLHYRWPEVLDRILGALDLVAR